MKTQILKSLAIQVILFQALLLASCQDDAETAPDNDKKKSEVEKVLSFQEQFNFVDRFIDIEMMEFPSDNSGRKSNVLNIINRVKEAAPCLEPVEEELPDGSSKITMDFGEGCATDDNTVQAGKVVLIIGLNETALKFSLKLINYREIYPDKKETIAISGTSSGQFTMDLETFMFDEEMSQEFTIDYADSKRATFASVQKRESNETGLVVTEGQSSGRFANNDTFTMTVTKPLVFDISCDEGGFPVKGAEVLLFNGNKTEIDYGAGACDKAYIIK